MLVIQNLPSRISYVSRSASWLSANSRGSRSAASINRADIGNSGVENYCREKNIPVVLKIPFDREIAEGYSAGIPLIDIQGKWREALQRVYRYALDNSRKK